MRRISSVTRLSWVIDIVPLYNMLDKRISYGGERREGELMKNPVPEYTHSVL